jgi:UDP-2-acetamido-3-amino-2,3-dideoxy-glucuronate N-acetyltransferase
MSNVSNNNTPKVVAKNIAVIGGGYWGQNLVRNFAGLGALHTICDSNPQSLSQLG